jgi:hypothetical protein
MRGRMAGWVGPLLALVALALCPACVDHKKRQREAQEARAAERKAYEAAVEEKRKAAAPKVERAQLDAFWDPPGHLRVTTGRPCPDGLWALFPETPGEGPVKEANEGKRAELAERVRAATFVAVMPHGTGLALRKYNAKKQKLTVEVDGVVECFDGLGLMTLAWGAPVRPHRPPTAGDDEEPLSPQSVWRAQPLLFSLPFATAAEAKAFHDGEGLGAEARIVFTLGKVAVDTRLLKAAHPDLADAVTADEELDWGAGRMVRAKLLGVRLATNHEKTLLVEDRK